MTEEELDRHIEGCKKNDRKSQKILYQSFYGYAMSICLRYAGSPSEASEILNDGFFKVFTQMHKYDHSRPFKPWLSRIMCNTSIDHCRANTKKRQMEALEKAIPPAMEPGIGEKLDYEYLLSLVQKLPPGYRMVFNLFVIDGYTHEEIAARLKINVGTSRSNLFKARQHLQQMLKGVVNVDTELKDTPIVPINQSFIDNIFHSKSRKP
ncbi:MAG TPA: sigma-70 family RNA polymerase sigma factor [Flavitalea sp.]|nr:sigma-70 family RNA polymerase sigma factor [Flavitalea sp.]